MSANPYYLAQGYTPQYRFTRFDAAGTLAIWTPTTSCRVVITGLHVGATNGGSMTLGWSYSSGGKQVAQFVLGGSAFVSPAIGAIEGTAIDGKLWAAVSAGGTDSWAVTAYGFEIPSF